MIMAQSRDLKSATKLRLVQQILITNYLIPHRLTLTKFWCLSAR